MAETKFHFRAQPAPTIIMVLLTPMFCGLGIWQLDRAEQKRSVAVSLEIRRKLPAQPLVGTLPATEQMEFRKVVAEGRFLNEKTVLIENRKHQGKTGYHVITPLLLTDSERIVLINRGWIPMVGPGGYVEYPNPEGPLRIEGKVNIPLPPALVLGQMATEETGTPHWPYLTLVQYASWSGLDIMPFMILQAPEKSSGFIRQWPHPQVNDGMHIGYAVQWFAFALITLVIWLRLSTLKKTPVEAQ